MSHFRRASPVFLSLILLVYFYRKVVNPLKSIANGMDLLREQDFSSRLSPVGQAEADRIVKMFNRMMDQLKNERLRLREQNHFLDLLISVSPMGVIILTFDNEVSMLNDAAVHFLGFSNKHEITGKPLKALTTPLAEEINRLDKDSTQTIRLSDSQIYRCSAPVVYRPGICTSFYINRESDNGSGQSRKESLREGYPHDSS